MSFVDELIQKGIIKKSDSVKILEDIQSSGGNVDSVLIKSGVSPEELAEIRSKYFGLPLRNIGDSGVPPDLLKYIPEESATHYKIAPLGVEEKVFEIGIVNPENIEAKDAVQFISSKLGVPFKLFVISLTDFEIVLSQYKGLSGQVNKALTELETELSVDDDMTFSAQKMDEMAKNGAESKTIIEEAPVTKIVASMLRYATEGKASDIHIEPMADKTRIRFRVDGVLHTSLLLPVSVQNALVARTKILANMRLDERRKPQDGRFSAKIAGRKVDFRVSTLPSYYGEKVVMRILDSEKGVKSLDGIGLSDKNLKIIRDAIKRPYGLVLLTGPTGSGKTTTLYAMLKEVNSDKQNVISLEDPIEYNMEGVNQSQVRPEIGYTFASGLRSILRQDPDIIMVGEIRDKETAQLAIQAALTGHLVFSTLHTNSSFGVIPRLVDMGVDPYLIAPTLIMAIGQRLVKTLCEDSKKEIPIEGSIKVMIEKQFSDLPEEYKKDILLAKSIFEAQPTDACPSGTRGRMSVMEILMINRDIEKIILENPVEQEIYKVARKQGMITMKEDALLKTFQGLVPIEEANKL